VTTFVLLHGAYGRGELFGPLVAELAARGHGAVAPDLPIEDRSAGFGDYADTVEGALSGTTGDVHVVGHSLGGVTAALVADRTGARVTYLAALLPSPGRPLADVFADEPMVLPEIPAAEMRGEDGLRRLPRAVADEVLHPGLDLRGQSVSPYFEPCPLDALPPGRYVVCREDRVVSPAWGREAAPRLLGREALELDGGHLPQLTRPAELADLLVAA
jgi:pimeloyl-ACP methyl ester carboxylesterase